MCVKVFNIVQQLTGLGLHGKLSWMNRVICVELGKYVSLNNINCSIDILARSGG